MALSIYVDPGDSDRAHYAMDSLKRSMKWDEEVFAREYDLDIFNIVAVRDFNFGAMENKSLNVFNSALVLADADTATDGDYEAIEAVVGHEYFHNWTGNRITCRDWFQLCLKEGLTVFREQEFSRRSTLALRAAHQGRKAPARAPIRRGRWPSRPPGAPVELSEDRQFLHRHRLRKRRRSDPHAEAPDRRRRIRARHATLLRAARRHRVHGGRFHRMLRRSVRARSREFHGMVRSGRHAGAQGARPLRSRRAHVSSDCIATHDAYAGPARESGRCPSRCASASSRRTALR